MQLVFLTYDKISSYSPRGVMDNTEDSGSSAGGSIPSEGAKFKRKPCINYKVFIYLTIPN